MGVDINTYCCMVGMFVPGGGCGFMSLRLPFGRVVKLLQSLTLVRILLFMAGVEQNPGPTDEKYIFRYQYLLVHIGTDVMRKIFDVRVGNDFSAYLAANNKASKKLQSLILAKIITADQTKHLPPIDMSPNSTNFDITLLACLLRNVCGLRGHTDPVWKNPQPSDFSLEAELARLKECRNNLQHSGSVFILETDLTDKWKELSQVLWKNSSAYLMSMKDAQGNSGRGKEVLSENLVWLVEACVLFMNIIGSMHQKRYHMLDLELNFRTELKLALRQ